MGLILQIIFLVQQGQSKRVQPVAKVAMLQGRAEGGLQRAEAQLFRPFLPPVVLGEEESVYVPPAGPDATWTLVPLDSSQRLHETSLSASRGGGAGVRALFHISSPSLAYGTLVFAACQQHSPGATASPGSFQ